MNVNREEASYALLLGVIVLSMVCVPVTTAAEPISADEQRQQDESPAAVPHSDTDRTIVDDALAMDHQPDHRSAVGARVNQVNQTNQTNQAPEIEVQPVTLRFSNPAYGTASRTFSLANLGNATLRVRSIDIVGPDQTQFDTDFDGPITVAPGENRTVTVSFTPTDGSPRFATLHVLSNDTNAPQVNVWLTNTETVANVSPSRLVGNLTLVNSTIQNAEANTTQSLNISWPLTRDDLVAVDALSFVPERSGDFAVNVTKSQRQFGGMAAFNLSDGTESAAFVQIDHTIENEDVRNVTVKFRVRKDRLADNETGPEDVSLYRYQGGVWRELSTQLVSEGDTHYFFEAQSPGLSDFTTGIKQAKFRIANAVVTVTTISTDEGTEVLVRVENVGGADGTYSVRLISEDEVVNRQDLSIAPSSARLASFGLSYDQPGTHELYVNDHFVANITVSGSITTVSEPTDSDNGQTPPDTGGTGILAVNGLGYNVAATLLAVLAMTVYAVSRQRRW